MEKPLPVGASFIKSLHQGALFELSIGIGPSRLPKFRRLTHVQCHLCTLCGRNSTDSHGGQGHPPTKGSGNMSLKPASIDSNLY